MNPANIIIALTEKKHDAVFIFLDGKYFANSCTVKLAIGPRTV